MKPRAAPRTVVAALATMLMLFPAMAWPQSRDANQQIAQNQVVQNGAASSLSASERQAFDARLKAAKTEQERKTIITERDNLIKARAMQSGDVRQIPASPGEVADDPIMSDVPTPRSERSWPYGTLPGGALAPTGTGTGPSPTTGGWGWGD